MSLVGSPPTAFTGIAERQDVIDPGLGDGRGLGQREAGGAVGFHPFVAEGGERLEAVHGAGNLEDDLVRHGGEDAADVEQLLDAVAVDLDHQRLVGDVEVGFHDVDHRAVLLDHLVEHNRVGDDAGDAEGHPLLQVLRVPGQPDQGAAAAAPGFSYRTGLHVVCCTVSFRCHFESSGMGSPRLGRGLFITLRPVA